MVISGTIAVVLLLIGSILLFVPKAIEQANDMATRVVMNVDEPVLDHNIIMGVILWIVATALMLIGSSLEF